VNGRVIFDGRDLTEMDERDLQNIRGREIAWIPQSQSSLNPVLTVGFQVSEPMIRHLNYDKRRAWRRVLEIFDFLKIGDRTKDYPHQFSGGMRQRVLVAMGISTDPKLIIADEPTKGLDSSKRDQVVELFKKIDDKTQLVITHDLDFAKDLSDRIAVMYCGEIVEVSDGVDFFKEPLHPYSQGLLDSLPSRGLKPIRGFQPSMVNPPKGCRFRERCEYADLKCAEKPPLVNIDGRSVRCWMYV
jgi:peptide/nickel transport system ATP-binding protein